MALSDMKVFNEYLKGTTIETVAQMIDKFNAASGGAIVLTAQGFDGDFMQEAFWQSVHSAQRRVDRYAAQASAAATDLSQEEEIKVKVAGGFGPIRIEPSQLTYMQQQPELALEMISRNLAEAILQDQLNSGIASAVAAIGNQAAATNDVSASAGVTYDAINGAHAKFGDNSQAIVCNVMNGAVYHKLIGQNLANSERLFVAGNVTIVDILGKLVVVTDAPALTVSTTDYNVLGLAAGGIMVTDGSDLVTNIETTNGQTRIETTMQADYTFGLGLKGYKWDTAAGGASPTDAELATGSNWDLVATSIKHSAGVLCIGDQS